MILCSILGLIAATANYACLPDVCADLKSSDFHSMQDLQAQRIKTLREALGEQGVKLDSSAQLTLKKSGHLLGVAKSNLPIKHPDGTVEIGSAALPAIPAGHPWASELSASDDAFYSFFEERIVRAGLFDPENPQHMRWANAYLTKQNSADPDFIGWTYANRTECAKIKYDAKGTMAPIDARL